MSWPTATLGDIAKIERNSISPADIASGSRYVGLEHIESGGGAVGFGQVTNGELASSKFRFGPNHILYGKLRPYLAKIVCPDFEGICSTDILPISAGRRVDKRYLLHFLRRPETVNWASSRAAGVNLPRLSPSELASLEILLPPLEEQRRIVAILDKADALRRKRKKALELLDGLNQSIFLSMFGDPTAPMARNKKPMGEVLSAIQSGWSPVCLGRPALDYEPGVLKLSAVTGREFAASENKAFPPDLSPKTETEIKDGDILFCRKNTRELVGASVYVWSTRRNLHMSDLIFRIVSNQDSVDSIFLHAQISMPSQRKNISELASGSSGSMPNISKSRLRELEIIVPDMGEQKKFSLKISRAHDVILNCRYAHESANLLFSSLERRAFSGERI